MTTVATTSQILPVGTWNVDPVHSHVGFGVEYVSGTFRGSFSPVDVKLEVGDDGAATLTGSVPVAGVRGQGDNLAAHLQAPDFFDAERTPDVSFEATDLRRTGDEIEVSGDLTIKGITL